MKDVLDRVKNRALDQVWKFIWDERQNYVDRRVWLRVWGRVPGRVREACLLGGVDPPSVPLSVVPQSTPPTPSTEVLNDH